MIFIHDFLSMYDRDPEPVFVRQALTPGIPSAMFGDIKFPFTLLHQNTALMPSWMGSYFRDEDFRDKAKRRICEGVLSEKPDVVGLCELFDDDERAWMRDTLSAEYPHSIDGPVEDDLDDDGGLLLLSRHPFLRTASHVYSAKTHYDYFSDKGILHARIRPPGSPCDVDIFYTHMQSTYGSSLDATAAGQILLAVGAALNFFPIINPAILVTLAPACGSTGENELSAQIGELAQFVQGLRDPEVPAFIMGDLNVSGPPGAGFEESAVPYSGLLSTLGNPMDLWQASRRLFERRQRVAQLKGVPFTEQMPNGSTWLDKASRLELGSSKYDYILMYPPEKVRPMMDRYETLIWAADGKTVSDHCGLLAKFSSALDITAGGRTDPLGRPSRKPSPRRPARRQGKGKKDG